MSAVISFSLIQQEIDNRIEKSYNRTNIINYNDITANGI